MAARACGSVFAERSVLADANVSGMEGSARRGATKAHHVIINENKMFCFIHRSNLGIPTYRITGAPEAECFRGWKGKNALQFIYI